MRQLAMAGVLVMFLVGTHQVGAAKTLEEILKEKGVITAEEYQEAARAKDQVRYEPGKGIVAETADGKYLARLGGYAQLKYTYTDFDLQGKNDTSDFDIRRWKLQLQGHLVSEKFGYKFQGDMKSGFNTEDAFFNYTFFAPLTVQVGQFKPPQARQELTSASRQLFPERSLANDTFNLGRDQGVQAAGSFAEKLVKYRIGVFNGNGPNTSNPDNRHMVTGRLDLDPLGPVKMDEAGWYTDKPLVNIGGSFAWNKISGDDVGSGFSRDNDVMDVALGLDGIQAKDRTVNGEVVPGFTSLYGGELTWLLWTANIIADWQGATFAAEYYHLNADPDEGDDWDADGYYVQAGYQVIPNNLEVAVRYADIKSDDDNASEPFDKSETQVGLNYYFKKHAAKIQTDYTMVEDDLEKDLDDHRFRIQAQIAY